MNQFLQKCFLKNPVVADYFFGSSLIPITGQQKGIQLDPDKTCDGVAMRVRSIMPLWFQPESA